MGTTERSPDDDAQNDTNSSRSSGDGCELEEKGDVGCVVIEIKTKGKEEIGREDVVVVAAAAVDSNQVNGNEIEGRVKDQTPPMNTVLLIEPDAEIGLGPEMKNKDEEIIDKQAASIDDIAGMRSTRSSYSNEKTVCRICHLGAHENQSLDDPELIQLGCGCKDELGFSHVQCAETWFKQKGNIRCEICGILAKNVRMNVINVEEDMRRLYLMELNHMSFMETATANANTSLSSGRETSHKCHRAICNLLLAFIVLIFFLPWFLHIDIL